MYGGKTTQDELREMEDEEESRLVDPYLKKKKRTLLDQKFRTIHIGPHDLLKNGQMIEVSISDAHDEEKFHPTDKVILCKHED